MAAGEVSGGDTTLSPSEARAVSAHSHERQNQTLALRAVEV